ncbi:MAG: hypothetical protein HYV97_12265 [Bdellovibrio sp.]|nr:hypothetical protein [Bdellovibrio sp.]
MKKMALLLALLLNVVPLQASNEQLKCSKAGTVIFFINGIDTKLRHYNQEIQRIKEIESESRYPSINLRVDPRQNAEVDGHHNRTDGFVTDVSESINQWLDEKNDSPLTADMAANIILLAQERLPNEIEKKKTELFLERNSTFTWRMEDLLEIVGKVNGHLESGKKVIILSESQGNFFANEAYNSLMTIQAQDNSIDRFAVLSNFQVASPTTPLNPKNSKLKLINDILKFTGQEPSYEPILVPVPGTGAQKHAKSPEDWMNHLFLRTYTLPDSYGFKVRKINSSDEYKTISRVFIEELHNSALALADNCIGPEVTVEPFTVASSHALTEITLKIKDGGAGLASYSVGGAWPLVKNTVTGTIPEDAVVEGIATVKVNVPFAFPGSGELNIRVYDNEGKYADTSVSFTTPNSVPYGTVATVGCETNNVWPAVSGIHASVSITDDSQNFYLVAYDSLGTAPRSLGQVALAWFTPPYPDYPYTYTWTGTYGIVGDDVDRARTFTYVLSDGEYSVTLGTYSYSRDQCEMR